LVDETRGKRRTSIHRRLVCIDLIDDEIERRERKGFIYNRPSLEPAFP
jgi:hypothetical protein